MVCSLPSSRNQDNTTPNVLKALRQGGFPCDLLLSSKVLAFFFFLRTSRDIFFLPKQRCEEIGNWEVLKPSLPRPLRVSSTSLAPLRFSPEPFSYAGLTLYSPWAASPIQDRVKIQFLTNDNDLQSPGIGGPQGPPSFLLQ